MSRYETVLKYFNEQKEQTDLRIKHGIETNRKGNAKIVFEGDTQNKDITVEAELVNHEFKFGANIFMLDEFETQDKNEIYRKKFPELFNLATVPFYWSDLEPIEGKPRYEKNSPKIYRRPAPDLCVEYCKENNIEPKCHCLNYENFSPNWLHNSTVDEVKRKLEKRFYEISQRYSKDILSFEVTNETLQSSVRQGTAFFNEDDFVEWSFKTADKYFPTNRLIINDYNIWQPNLGQSNLFHKRVPYYMQIEKLLNSGISHIDSIGMQFHSFFSRADEENFAKERYNPEYLFNMLDCYATLGLAEQITEMTIPAYSASEEDEQIQSLLAQNVYKIFFSHPAMEAVIYWNIPDGYAAFAPLGDMSAGENMYYGGMLRHDLSEKPIFKDLKNLIRKEWHTHEVVKSCNGAAEWRGFYGDYKLKIYVDGKEIKKDFKLSKNAYNDIKIKL